VAADMQLFKGC